MRLQKVSILPSKNGPNYLRTSSYSAIAFRGGSVRKVVIWRFQKQSFIWIFPLERPKSDHLASAKVISLPVCLGALLCDGVLHRLLVCVERMDLLHISSSPLHFRLMHRLPQSTHRLLQLRTQQRLLRHRKRHYTPEEEDDLKQQLHFRVCSALPTVQAVEDN